jgi:hypothetical protein
MAPLRRLLALLEAGPLTSRQLQQQLGVSQPTVSRLVKRAAMEVTRLGRGPGTRYARTRPVFGTRMSLSLFEVDEAGVLEQVATLQSLAGGGYVVRPAGARFWLLGDSGSGVFDSLPYFLYDLRPSGFIGRQIARRLAAEWGTPPDPRGWSDEEIGRYLLERGDDLPGNLVVGEAAAHRVNQRDPVAVVDRPSEYPRQAELALADGAPGSSAAGEQPKFVIYHGVAGHVIVKFSPAGRSDEAWRWRDLLRAEHHALGCVRGQGIEAAPGALHDLGGRLFLESRRFDRHGARGRGPAISLGMVDAEFGGRGHGWARAARSLHDRRLLDRRDLDRLVWLETFGGWIGNTDMHLGNISLRPLRGEGRFELLPVYDMLPMALAPVRGEMPSRPLRPPLRSVEHEEIWRAAGLASVAFWRGLAEDALVSDGFRAVAERQARDWEALLRG